MQLTGKLMKAITSVKLSPTGRFGLIGYGVRDGQTHKVIGHPLEDVACEVVRLENMESVYAMQDDRDEVNIAQFHPDPGKGLLYGTKTGGLVKFRTT